MFIFLWLLKRIQTNIFYNKRSSEGPINGSGQHYRGKEDEYIVTTKNVCRMFEASFGSFMGYKVTILS
jgi:hypothetical protein